MKTARNVAGHYNHSTQAAEKLKNLANINGKAKGCIDNDVITRWWSTKKLCESMVTLEVEIKFLQADLPQSCHLTDIDWLIIKAADVILEPFMIVQKGLEGEHYVTNSLVIPLIMQLRCRLIDVIELYRPQESVIAQKIFPTAQRMLITFNEKFGDGTNITTYQSVSRNQPRGFYPQQVCATALDPRTKNLKCIPRNERESVWKLLKDQVVSHMQSRIHDKPSIPVAKVDSGRSSLPKETLGLFDNLFDSDEEEAIEEVEIHSPAAASPITTLSPNEDTPRVYESIVEIEIASYKAAARLSFENEEKCANNPLDWWRSNAVKFPNLANFARRVLAIPATSAPSERIYSVAGQIVTKKRNRLTGDTVTLLVWLRGAWEEVESYLEENRRKRKIVEIL
jgi:hypothetical protein